LPIIRSKVLYISGMRWNCDCNFPERVTETWVFLVLPANERAEIPSDCSSVPQLGSASLPTRISACLSRKRSLVRVPLLPAESRLLHCLLARLAGRIEGQQEAMGIQFAFEDLLISATALHLGYEVATLNLRDFEATFGRQQDFN
jgi:hypothetical protein